MDQKLPPNFILNNFQKSEKNQISELEPQMVQNHQDRYIMPTSDYINDPRISNAQISAQIQNLNFGTQPPNVYLKNWTLQKF